MINLQIGIPRPTYLVDHECTEPLQSLFCSLAASAQIPFVRMAVDEEPRVWKPRRLIVLGLGYSHQNFCAAKNWSSVFVGSAKYFLDLPGDLGFAGRCVLCTNF